MFSLVQKDVKDMLSKNNDLCISIMMPIVSPGKGDEENKIRIKNMLQKCEDELISTGFKKNEAEERLRETKELVNSQGFFRSQDKGMVIYIGGDFMKHYNVPYHVTEKVVIGDAFFIKPLVPSLNGDGEYFILGLSKNNSILFSATKNSIFEVDISEVTKEADKQIALVDSQKHFTLHSASSGGSGAIFHGQDNSALEKDIIVQYFRLIEDGLRPIFNKHEYPVVLAGVDYLLPIYQDINKYPKIIPKGIFGSAEDLAPTVIHKKTWEIMEPIFKEEMIKDIETFHQFNGTGNASSNIEEIIPKSEYGQVASLFINLDEINQGDLSDLLNKAAINTIKNNGNVYGIDTAELLNHLSVAAVYRY